MEWNHIEDDNSINDDVNADDDEDDDDDDDDDDVSFVFFFTVSTLHTEASYNKVMPQANRQGEGGRKDEDDDDDADDGYIVSMFKNVHD